MMSGIANTLVNELVFDTYETTLDGRDCGKFARVCLTKQGGVAFVITKTHQRSSCDVCVPAKQACEYRREALQWLVGERNQTVHSGVRFDVICVDEPTRMGHLIENAF